MSKDWDDAQPSYAEQFHALLIDEFHAYRKGKDHIKTSPPTIAVDGKVFSEIVTNAKRKLYKKCPEAVENLPL